MKQRIHNALNLEAKSGPEVMHFPIGMGFNSKTFKELCAEERKIKWSKGFAVPYWAKRSKGRANEYLDNTVYGWAMFYLLGKIDWDALQEQRDKREGKSAEQQPNNQNQLIRDNFRGDSGSYNRDSDDFRRDY